MARDLPTWSKETSWVRSIYPLGLTSAQTDLELDQEIPNDKSGQDVKSFGVVAEPNGVEGKG